MNLLIWGVYPIICLASFFIGHVWRYRYDKFGWTSRSSQMYEEKVLSVGSPLFHFGILAVFAGHFLMLVPESFTQQMGLSNQTYHLIAEVPGSIAGTAAVLGLIILIVRRGSTRAILQVTSRMDYVMYVLLAAIVIVGMYNTIGVNVLGTEHDYRLDIAVWFRSLFVGQPAIDLMGSAPLSFQIHDAIAFALFAIWPYTRLVHVWSVPLAYIGRPYVVYRTPDDHKGGRAPRRGWDEPGF
jgi:nitrate reductase gamma subunit